MNYLWDVLGDGRYRFAAHSVLAIVDQGESTVVYLSGARGGLLVNADSAAVNGSFDEYISNSMAAEHDHGIEQIDLPEDFEDWEEQKQVDYLNGMLGNDTEGEN